MIQVKLSDGRIEMQYRSYNASSKKFFSNGGIFTVNSDSDDIFEAIKEALDIFKENHPEPFNLKPEPCRFH